MRITRTLVSATVTLGLACTVAACSSGDEGSSPTPNPSTSAPIRAGELVLTGKPVKGSSLLLNGILTNSSSDPITIVGGSAYFATQLQVVSNVVKNGKRSVLSGVPLKIEGNDSVPLSPQGFQIRVIRLTQSLVRGTTVPLNLTLATGQTTTAEARVS